MISRQWRGLAKPGLADAYVEHLRRETLPGLARIEGFISASIMRRPVIGGVEFLIVTLWDSLDAIAHFAGPELERAVVPNEVQEMMVEFDEHVRHYEVVRGTSPDASERGERATRSERAGEAARESACRGVRGAKPLG